MTLSTDRRGVALITSLAILAIVGVLVLGAIFTTQVELAVSRNDNTSTQAQYVAQAGLQKYKSVLFQNFRWIEESGGGGGSNLDACTNSLATGIDFDRDGTLAGDDVWVSNRIDLGTESVTNANGDTVIGEYQVSLLRDPANLSRISLRSVGRTVAGPADRRATATASATFFVRNSSTLEQAIFAGLGSDMRFVNGNTTVYGGVYIVGDLADPETVVIESNGNFGVYNGYDKSDDGSNVAFLVDEARSSSNLCAALRVQSGTVAVGGSTQLGTQDNPLITVAVSRGSDDITFDRGGTEDCQRNKGVCTEVGPKPFDIDEPPVFPMLDEEPATEFCPAGNTWRSCIRDEATDDGTIITTNGGSTIDLTPPLDSLGSTCTAALNAAASSSTKTLAFGASPLDCTYVDDDGLTRGFDYDPGTTPATFEVLGNLNIRGLNLEFSRDTQYQAQSQDDAGVAQTFAGLSIEAIGGDGGNMLATGDFVADQAVGKFPDNVLSIIAEEYVHFAANQGYYTAPVYAGEQFQLRGNAQLFGQVIGNQFCTTNGGAWDPADRTDVCSTAGNPAEIVFVPTGANRAKSFRAIAPTGGLPTFQTVGYELR